MNKTFANFYKEIDKDDYLNSFKAAILLKDSYRRFPTDDEFKRELIYKDVYNFRSKNYLLEKLENSQHSKDRHHNSPNSHKQFGPINVKTLAEIAQLVSFKEKPPDALTYKQLLKPAKKIAMALHVHA
jgi:hypothetical protein